MEDLAERARTLTADGVGGDDLARDLLSRTTFPIAVIKALVSGAGLSLGEAKTVVHRNLEPDAREAAEKLWADLRAAARGAVAEKP
jgi:ribosomal protein L7/L12